MEKMYIMRQALTGTAAVMLNLMPVFELLFSGAILHEESSSTQRLDAASVLYEGLSTGPVSRFHPSLPKSGRQ